MIDLEAIALEHFVESPYLEEGEWEVALEKALKFVHSKCLNHCNVYVRNKWTRKENIVMSM